MAGGSRAELVRGLAMIALGSATILQLVGVQMRATGGNDGEAPSAVAFEAAADLVVSELRRTGLGGLLHASEHAIALRVASAVGVVCATGEDATVVAVLPALARSVAGTTGSGIGWQDATGELVVRDGRIELRPVSASACAASAVTAPAGSLYLAVTPATAAARVGGPAVLFERVEYEFRPSSVDGRALALWRTAGHETRELLGPLDGSAGFVFYVDAASSPTATVPAPLARVRGVELNLANGSSDRVAAVMVAHATAVFFRRSAS